MGYFFIGCDDFLLSPCIRNKLRGTLESLVFLSRGYDAFNIASDNFQTDILLRRMLTDRTRARHKVEKVRFWESQ